MWWLFQSLVIFAVMCVAIYCDWQHVGGYDEGIAPVAVAIFAAWLVTLSKLIDFTAGLSANKKAVEAPAAKNNQISLRTEPS
jgi:hypothetical protein